MTATASYIHLRQRVFGEPLMIHQQKLEVILDVLSGRLGIESPLTNADRERLAGAPLSRQQESDLDYSGSTTTEDGIRLIAVRDTLVNRARGIRALSGMTGYQRLRHEIREAVADGNVRAILLDVDSPGGEAQGSFDLADEIRAARAEKPVFAAASKNAFSAAYLLASQASRVYVSQDSGVGSIGVYMVHVDQSEANEKLGLKPTFIFAGARKIDGHSHAPLPDDVRERVQSRVNKTYDMFVSAVSAGRELTKAEVQATEADVFFGQEAIDRGLATHLGTLDTALGDLRQEIAAMDELTTLKAENAALTDRAEALQATIDEQKATIAQLEEQAKQHADDKRQDFLSELDRRCQAANVLPLTATERSEVLRALALDESIGKQLGEAIAAKRTAATRDEPREDETEKTLDPHGGKEEADRKKFAESLADRL